MTKPTLTYFDFPGGRGEDCRLALHVAGVDFHDDRLKGPDWGNRKPDTPFGALPVLSMDGRTLGQSNAILSYIGRTHGLHPTDAWEAAEHDAVMMFVEDLRHKVATSTRSESEDEKKASRMEFADGYLKMWADRLEQRIEGPFLAGDALNVADLKIAGVMNWFRRGGVDHIEPTYFDRFARLTALSDAVYADPRVKSWYE